MAVGRRYEQLAADFFIAGGFTILERNYRAGSCEIDLVVRRNRLVVFVEVKAARDEAYGHPAERVDERKQGHLVEAARWYMAEHDITGCDVRFDCVTFVRGRIEHYPNAFLAEE